jgi:hypothetical protein
MPCLAVGILDGADISRGRTLGKHNHPDPGGHAKAKHRSVDFIPPGTSCEDGSGDFD